MTKSQRGEPLTGDWSRRRDVAEIYRIELALVKNRLQWVTSEMHHWIASLVRDGAHHTKVTHRLRLITEKHTGILERQMRALQDNLPAVRLEQGAGNSLQAYTTTANRHPVEVLGRMKRVVPSDLNEPVDG